VRWSEKWPNIKVSGQICLILNGSAERHLRVLCKQTTGDREREFTVDTYRIVVSRLGSSDHLVPAGLLAEVGNQLQAQGRQGISRHRYAVGMEIVEGCARPAKDLDNYAKPIIDAVTQSRMLWNDDTQIDELVIRRRRDGNSADSSVEVTLRRIGGQHGGVPTHFRARCAEAAQGVSTYSHVGYYLATVLMREIPYDLEEEDWLNAIAHLTDMLDAEEENNVWIWFHEHLPKFMACIPSRHRGHFLSGVHRAHEEGRIGE
jgi:hypothetical protein